MPRKRVRSARKRVIESMSHHWDIISCSSSSQSNQICLIYSHQDQYIVLSPIQISWNFRKLHPFLHTFPGIPGRRKILCVMTLYRSPRIQKGKLLGPAVWPGGLSEWGLFSDTQSTFFPSCSFWPIYVLFIWQVYTGFFIYCILVSIQVHTEISIKFCNLNNHTHEIEEHPLKFASPLP